VVCIACGKEVMKHFIMNRLAAIFLFLILLYRLEEDVDVIDQGTVR